MKPLQIIDALRHNVKGSRAMFTQGKCFQLYLMLKELFPQAVAWYDPVIGHVYTEIDSEYYDIYGLHQYLPECSHLVEFEPKINLDAYTWDCDYKHLQGDLN